MTGRRWVVLGLTGLGVALALVKVTTTAQMIACGVMSTPAVVVDERVVHAGGIPTRAEVEGWVRAFSAASDDAAG